MACFTYNPSSSIKLQGVYNSENWLPPLTSPTPARRRPSTIADMMVGIEPGGYSGYSESGTISYQLSPQPGPLSLSLSLYLCCAVAAVCPVQVQQHLFFLSAASRASAHSGSSDWSQPGRTQRVRIRPCQSLSVRREVFSYREVE